MSVILLPFCHSLSISLTVITVKKIIHRTTELHFSLFRRTKRKLIGIMSGRNKPHMYSNYNFYYKNSIKFLTFNLKLKQQDVKKCGN